MQVDYSPSIYSDPSMRSHLEKYYQQKYQPVYERIEAMEASEAAGTAPKTVRLSDTDTVAIELSAAQYRAAIPSFDKWLELQQGLSEAESRVFDDDAIERTQQRLDFIEDQHPDTSSGVRTVFSDGDRILGYVNDDGSVVTHDGGSALRTVAETADRMNLTGEERLDFIRAEGEKALASYSELEVTRYTADAMPTKRAFAEQWYPQHDVDSSYAGALAEMRQHLQWMDEQRERVARNRNDMMLFLIQSQQEADTTATVEAAAGTVPA